METCMLLIFIFWRQFSSVLTHFLFLFGFVFRVKFTFLAYFIINRIYFHLLSILLKKTQSFFFRTPKETRFGPKDWLSSVSKEPFDYFFCLFLMSLFFPQIPFLISLEFHVLLKIKNDNIFLIYFSISAFFWCLKLSFWISFCFGFFCVDFIILMFVFNVLFFQIFAVRWKTPEVYH